MSGFLSIGSLPARVCVRRRVFRARRTPYERT
jgi:hypothetical protein